MHQPWQFSHQISRYVYHQGRQPRASTLRNTSLSAASMSSWASQAHAFHQPVCQRLSWLYQWSVPHVHTSGAFSLVERCGAVVKHRTRDREVPGSIPTNCKCCFLEQETLSTLLSTGFYPGKKRATWKISTRLLNVLPSINKVDYYYYYYYYYFRMRSRSSMPNCTSSSLDLVVTMSCDLTLQIRLIIALSFHCRLRRFCRHWRFKYFSYFYMLWVLIRNALMWCF